MGKRWLRDFPIIAIGKTESIKSITQYAISDGGLMGDSHDMTLVGRRLFMVEKNFNPGELWE